MAKQPLFQVKNLSVTVKEYGAGLRENEQAIVHNLNLSVHESEIVAVVGASGSGKSILAHAILGILPNHFTVSGQMLYKGQLMMQKISQLRGTEIALIPQSVNALDPLMKVGKQVKAVMKGNHKQERMEKLFHQIGLDKRAALVYPFELSGGMARRVLMAIAVLSGADLLIADEATPGLDPKVLQETVHTLDQLRADGKGIVFITHDLKTAVELADRIAVFYKGKMVDKRPAKDFNGDGELLTHPYTKALWQALPQNGFQVHETLAQTMEEGRNA